MKSVSANRVAVVRQIKMARASVSHTPSYARRYAPGTLFFKLDRRMLERNKYAPWGRGSAAYPDTANEGAVV